jgi:phosphopantetheinyl transferase
LSQIDDPNLDVNTKSSTSNRRQSQLLSANLLASHIVGRSIEISRDYNGKPYIIDLEPLISISHTGKWMSIIINDTNSVAIDIERVRRNVGPVKSKFTTHAEIEKVHRIFPINPEILIWSCKECLFKILPFEGILFIENLVFDSAVQSNTESRLKTRWKVTHEHFIGHYTVNSFIFEDFLISYIDNNAEV